ncbi:MAG: Rpn family recombination-promoting nuclease/putative transposase [Anaerolineae bacterium]|nr:Rpn family recombination-promoting nuclease/putative transposase [Anaerolineae bacterium]
MNTDRLFYEYFQTAPQAFFELLQIEPGCSYRFESLVVKTSEKRLDGVLEPEEPGHPRYFLEIQGYPDPSIYWRSVRQVGTFFEQRPHLIGEEWLIVVLFLDPSYDPGLQTLGSMNRNSQDWLKQFNLVDALTHLPNPTPLINVLRPLIAKDSLEIGAKGPGWVEAIRKIPTQKATQERLLQLMVQFIGQKFTQLAGKEITKMLKLTPVEETVWGREWLAEGQISLLSEQIEEKFGIDAQTAVQKMQPLSYDDLRLLGRFLLKAKTYSQIEAWIAGRLAVA